MNLQISENLSEIIGIHYNVGNMTDKYRIDYTFNLDNKQEAKYTKKLIETEFNCKFKREKTNENLVIYRHSKEIWRYLETLGILKKDKVPNYIKQSNTLSKYFLKGFLSNNDIKNINNKELKLEIIFLIKNNFY